MLSSKANAALTRVKEIEEKYKMKRREQRWNRTEDTDSSISTVSLNLSENLSKQLKESSGNSPKPKLDIKMPDMRFEGHEESAKLPLQDKQSDRMNQAVDEADLDVAMPSEDKSSSRSIRKQESFASDIITIQENSSIESVLDDSMVSSKSLSRSKTLQRRSSTANEEYSRHEGSMKTGLKSEKEKQFDKLSGISREKSSSANSSVAKRSKILEKSNKNTSKPRSYLKSGEHSIEEKKVTKVLRRMSSGRSSRNSNHSGSSRGNSVIDESIDTLEDGSEIISEFSHIEKSIAEKTVDSSAKIVSSNSGRSSAENVSADVSSRLKHPAGENGYVNDTFEDISSSTVRSKSRSHSEKIMDGKKNAISLTVNPNTDDIKISLSEEPSNDVENVENIDSKTGKKVSRRKGSVVVMTSASRQESDREERGKVLDETRERLMMDVIGLPVTTDERSTEQTKSGSSRKKSEPTKSSSSKEKSEPMKSSSSREKSKPTKSTSSRKKIERSGEDENVLAESSDRRIPQNVTNVLRKMHRDAVDAMARRHANLKTVGKVYESSYERRTESEILEATSRRTKREESHHSSSEEDKMTENNNREHSTKRKKRKARVTYSEPAETRDCAGSHKEYKTLRYDRKQIRELQKRVVELRLQQEREDLQKYIHELKDLRLGGSGSTPNYFSPLEFPKIAEFTPPVVLYRGERANNRDSSNE
ncbi:uncharacterized protein YFR016C-like isoform X2 [Odontomachus brunneus]|uniref:uncharacterized protein YFR016C-like isoform X2 n=1 Tax=Odontomachus brunneus TaxID=486640 RepID=UPI0013F1FB20|nr:uncharacterized protein YFR016C-like isoform X2 [Odontomachus brunneus]